MTLMMHSNDTIPAALVKPSLNWLQASSTHQLHPESNDCVLPADTGAAAHKPKSANQQ